MTTRNSHPPIQNPGRRPLDSIDSLHPSSLPPELGSLDMAWDDDPNSVGAIDLLQNSELMDIDVDANERTTAIPEIPMDQLVRATMAEADARESAVPPALAAETPNPPPLDHRAKAETPPIAEGPRPKAQQHSNLLGEHSAMSTRNRGSHGAPLTSTLLRHGAPAPSGAAEALPLVKRDPRPAELPPENAAREASPLSSNGGGRLEFAISEPAPSFDARLTSPPTMRRADVALMRHQMKDCYATGNFTGALEVSEALLKSDPGDLEAQRFVTSCRDVLTQMLLSRIGPTNQYVRVALSQEELRWLNLDHRAGFFLSLIDGTLTIDELLDVSGMARLESLRILSTLLEQRVLRLEAH